MPDFVLICDLGNIHLREGEKNPVITLPIGLNGLNY